MKRRNFLKASSLLSVPSLIGGVQVSSLATGALSSFVNGDSDRVLVLIQLNGGNDGLNMVVPVDQYANLALARPNILLPESSLLSLNTETALHPTMSGIKNLFEEEQCKIIQSVSYPNQNRSHFRSSDIWHSGSGSDEFLTTGWLGRYFDTQFPSYPELYPNEECTDPFAMTIGSVVSETCQGIGGNFSMAIVDPENLSPLAAPLNNELAQGCGAGRLSFVAKAIEQTNEYTDVLQAADSLGNNMSSLYQDDNDLATKLKTVAKLISGGLKTKVYVVSLGGFDTHAFQANETDPTTGIHATLLQTLSDAIYAFQDDLKLLGLEERVIGMTYSEFGRRIRSNASAGTDHGTAAPLFLFGNCINHGIVGDNPEIPENPEQNEGVPMQVDFRSVYGSVLMDWFDVAQEDVESLFSHDFQYIPVADNCSGTTSTSDLTKDPFDLRAFPNPFSSGFTTSFYSQGEWLKISLFNSLGAELKVLLNKSLPEGIHELPFQLNGYPAGAYFVRIQNATNQKTLRLMKV